MVPKTRHLVTFAMYVGFFYCTSDR